MSLIKKRCVSSSMQVVENCVFIARINLVNLVQSYGVTRGLMLLSSITVMAYEVTHGLILPSSMNVMEYKVTCG